MEPPGKKFKTDPNNGTLPEARTEYCAASAANTSVSPEEEDLEDVVTSPNPGAYFRVRREVEDNGSFQVEERTTFREDPEGTNPATDDDDSLQEERKMETEEEDDDSLQTAEEATSVNISHAWKDRLPKPGTAQYPKSFQQVLTLMDTLIDREPGDASFWDDLYNHSRHGNRKGIKTRVLLRNLKKKGDFSWHEARGEWCPQTTDDLSDFIIVLMDIAERWS